MVTQLHISVYKFNNVYVKQLSCVFCYTYVETECCMPVLSSNPKHNYSKLEKSSSKPFNPSLERTEDVYVDVMGFNVSSSQQFASFEIIAVFRMYSVTLSMG